MAFTVEDGTGIDGANAYAAVADADTHFTDRGETTWTSASTAQKQQALIKATDYIEARFGRRFLGQREFTTQDLSFPRLYLYDREGDAVEGIPDKLKKACFEYALRALSASLWNEPEMNPKGKLVTERVKVGPIEEDTRYSFIADTPQIKPVPAADRLLQEYLFPAATAVR